MNLATMTFSLPKYTDYFQQVLLFVEVFWTSARQSPKNTSTSLVMCWTSTQQSLMLRNTFTSKEYTHFAGDVLDKRTAELEAAFDLTFGPLNK